MSNQRKVKIMEVTPEVALRWLEHNTHNRDLRQAVVNAYAAAMKLGKWVLTPEPIAFCRPWTDEQGNNHPETLIEGQHRLWAVVESGCAVEFTVWWGCEPSEFGVIGQGIDRTQGDVLQITRRDIKHPTKVASVLSSTKAFILAKNQKMMTWETELLLNHFGREADLVVEYKNRLGKIGNRSVQAALFVCTLIDEAKTAALVERLHTAVGFTERDPVRALHLYLNAQLTEATPDPNEWVLYKTLHACLAFIDGRPIQKLQPLIDFLGEARRRAKNKLEPALRQLHQGKLPQQFYTPRGTLRPVVEKKKAA